ncbi:MAG: autotransporter-associated beta strand repeat-containing protein, partial [Chthoniobacterales bacterium]
MYFDTAGSGNVTNNMTDWLSFSLVFNSGAASFTNSGNSINVQGKIENNSTNTQTISLANISAANGVKELNPVNGDLVINSANLYLGSGGGGEWRVWGANGKTLTINGVISESGTFRINQNSTVVFQKTNTYSGQTYIHHGQLIISNGASAGTNTINLGGTNTIGVSATNALYLGTASSSGGVTNGSAISVNTGGGASTLGGNNTSGTNEFSGGITLNQGATLTASSGGTLSVSGVISGAGGFTNSGAGTVIFSGSGANTASGGSTISAGTTVFNKSANTAAIAGPLTVNSGATLRTDAANQFNNQFVTVNGTLNMNSQAQSLALAGAGTVTMNATLTNNSTGTDTFSGKLTSSGALVKTNTGTLILSGSANDYTGATTVGGGTLAVSTNNALGATNAGTTIGSGGTLDLRSVTYSTAEAVTNNGGTIAASAGTSSFAGGITLGANSTFDVGGTQLTLGGVIDDGASTFGITKSGSGVLILTNANTYDGNTTISAGTILAGNNAALGSTGTASVSAGARLQLSNNLTIARNLTLSGDGISGSGSLQNVSGNNTWSGVISNASAARINSDAGTLTVSTDINSGANNLYIGGSGNTTVNGLINGTATTGNGALYKDGAGVLTLSANNSGLTGLVRLLGGTISITNNNSLGSGTLELGGLATQAILLVGTNTSRSQAILIADGSSNSVINVAAGSVLTNGGNVTGGGNNATKFGKAGAGTLLLSGTASTYGGQIQVGNGTLIIGSNNGLSTNTTTVNRGVDLGLDISDTSTANNVAVLASNAVTISNSFYIAPNTSSALRTIGISGAGTNTFNNEFYLGGNLTVDAGANATDQVTMSGNILNTSGLIKTNAGILVLSGGSSTFTGGVTLGSGTLRVGNNSALGTGTFTINGGTFASDSSTARTNTNAITMGGNVQLGDATGTGALVFSNNNINLGAATRTLTVSNSTTFWGAITNGGLTKAGAGTMALAASNSYDGVTTVSAGVLRIGNSGALGSTNGGTVVESGAQLRLITGVAGATSFGNGEALTISGDGGSYLGALRSGVSGETNTYQGKVTLAANATVNAGSGTILILDVASGDAVDLAGNTVTFLGAGTHQVNDGIVGSGGLTKDGTGTLTLSASNSYSGGTLITLGTLQIGNGSTTGSVAGVITNNGTLAFNRSDNLTNSGTISGTGNLTKS